MAYPDQSAEKKVAINFKKKRSEKEKGGWRGGRGPEWGQGEGPAAESWVPAEGLSRWRKGCRTLWCWSLAQGFQSLGKAPSDSYLPGWGLQHCRLMQAQVKGQKCWASLHLGPSSLCTPDTWWGWWGRGALSAASHTRALPPAETWGPRPPARNPHEPQVSSQHSLLSQDRWGQLSTGSQKTGSWGRPEALTATARVSLTHLPVLVCKCPDLFSCEPLRRVERVWD